MGGISYPLLADFHPKGAMAEAYGLYLADKGITDRATVIIDAGGTVRYAASVGPGGQRDIAALAAECEKVNNAYKGDLPAAASACGMGDGGVLYVRSSCGASRAVLLAADNLHARDALTIKNVSDDAAALAELESATGGTQAPALVMGDKPLVESGAIIECLVGCCSTL